MRLVSNSRPRRSTCIHICLSAKSDFMRVSNSRPVSYQNTGALIRIPVYAVAIKRGWHINRLVYKDDNISLACIQFCTLKLYKMCTYIAHFLTFHMTNVSSIFQLIRHAFQKMLKFQLLMNLFLLHRRAITIKVQ